MTEWLNWTDSQITMMWSFQVSSKGPQPYVCMCPLLLWVLLSYVQFFATPWTAPCQHFLSFTISQMNLGELISTESVMPFNRLILWSPSVAFSLSQHQGLFQWLGSSPLVAKYWSFSFSISPSNFSICAAKASTCINPSNEYSGLISFRMNWFDLLANQGTLKSFLQHHSSKASILWCSAFFMVQLSHPYMTTGKTIALSIRTFIGKVMSLLFNMLSRFVVAFLPRSKHLFISWLQSPSALILEPKKINSVTVSIVCHCPHPFCHELMGQDAMIFIFWMLSFKPAFSLSFTFIKRLFSSSLLSAIRVVSSAYLKLPIILPEILIPVCALSSLAFCMVYSAHKLNKQGDNM